MFYFYAMLALQWNIKTLESCIFCISYSNCELFLFYGFFCRNRSKLLEITLNTVLFCYSWWKIGGFFWRIYKVSNCATFINNSFSPVIIIWSNILQTADSDDDITHFYLETPRNRVDCGLISNVPIWITFEFFEFIWIYSNKLCDCIGNLWPFDKFIKVLWKKIELWKSNKATINKMEWPNRSLTVRPIIPITHFGTQTV